MLVLPTFIAGQLRQLNVNHPPPSWSSFIYNPELSHYLHANHWRQSIKTDLHLMLSLKTRPALIYNKRDVRTITPVQHRRIYGIIYRTKNSNDTVTSEHMFGEHNYGERARPDRKT